jgi:hypothetical protein
LMFLTQIWTQFNIKQLCTLSPGTTLRFEHFFAIDLLIALNLPKPIRKFISFLNLIHKNRFPNSPKLF